MSGLALFVCSVLVYAGFPLLVAWRRSSYQFLLLYAHVAALLTIGGVLNGAYVLPIAGHVALLAGQVAYGGFMFTTLVTVVVGRDLQVVRNVIALTVLVDVVNFSIFRLSYTALAQGRVPNPFDADPAILGQSLRVLVVGGVLIIGELLVLIAILELAKRRLGAGPMAAVYVVGFVGILALDGVLFPALVLLPPSGLGSYISAGVQAKLVLAAAFAVPLMGFVALNRRTVDRFEATPLHLGQLVSVSRDPLHERLEETTLEAGRTDAVVSRLLDAASTTAMVATGPDMRITHANRGAQELLGYTREELVGQLPSLFHAPAQLAHQAAQLGTAADPLAVMREAARVGGRREWLLTGKDGTQRPFSLEVAEIRDGEGALIGYLTSGDDITDRLKAEAALTEALAHERRAVARLEVADRVKDELVSTISHELRTPITSIHGYGELLVDGTLGDLNPGQSDALTKVLRNTSRLEALVEDLLFVARADAGELTLRAAPVDLGEVVGLVRDSLEQLSRDRRLDLRYELPGAPVRVLGDSVALERMLGNLGGNAVKFTPDGGSVTIALHQQDGTAVLTVADTGIGISEEDRAHLFSRFFRAADANRRAIPGSGLGLSVVEGIVTRHGGTVGVQSALGQGTCIEVRLPTTS